MSRAVDTDAVDLDVGDVIIVDRSIGELETRTFAAIVAIGARGPRIVGPDYPVASYANALKIDGKTSYDRIVGRDNTRAYHLLQRDAVGKRVLDVLEAPGSDPEYRQPLADEDLDRWIEHVDDRRGWDTVAEEFVDVIDGEDSS